MVPVRGRYRFRKVTAAERSKLRDLIVAAREWGEAGRPLRIEVPNIRNSNGYWIEFDRTWPGSVKVTRYISRAWADANGYRWVY